MTKKANKINWKKFGKVAVFIDVSNVIYSLRSLGWKMDYKKLYEFFNAQADIADIYFYTSIRRNNNKDKKWVNLLRRFGYKVRVRFTKFIRKNDGEIEAKGNLDSYIIIDAIDKIKLYEACVLLSGDSDFEVLVDYLQEKKKQVIICSTRRHVACELRKKADKYLSLEYFREFAEYKQGLFSHKFENKKSQSRHKGGTAGIFTSPKRGRCPISPRREGRLNLTIL
jgi:uncharacterized LabA/DUF88 family protein